MSDSPDKDVRQNARLNILQAIESVRTSSPTSSPHSHHSPKTSDDVDKTQSSLTESPNETESSCPPPLKPRSPRVSPTNRCDGMHIS